MNRADQARCLFTRFALLVPAAFAAAAACAAPVSWNSAVSSNWNNASNWTPPAVPGTGDDVTIGDVVGTEGTRVTLDINDTVLTLNLQSGNEFDTDDFELVATSASITGLGTELLVKPNNGGALDSFDVDFVDVTSNATVRMLGGRLEVDGNTGDGRLDLTTGATLIGYGTIDLEDSAPGSESRFTLSSSTLNVGNTTDGLIILTDVPQTLTVNATDPNVTADLDQGGSTVNLLASGTLDLNVPIVPATDTAFSSTMNLFRKSTLDVEDAWNFNGTMNVNTTAGIFLGQTAGPATITGGTFTQTGGSINLDNAADHLIFDTGYQSTAGTISLQSGAITFNANSTIAAGVDFSVSNSATDSTEVNIGPGATVTVNDANWNWDGAGVPSNVINIADNGRLNANITAIADRYSGTMNIDGGILNVNGLNNEWGQDGGTITVTGDGTPAGTSSFFGDKFIKNGGVLQVQADGILVMDVETEWTGGTLNVNGEAFASGPTTWNGATVNGIGLLSQADDATVTADQTIDVATYDMDGTVGSAIDITIEPGNTFTINSAAIDTSGGFNGNLNVNSATLDVNTANWELGNLGDINLANTGSGGAVLAPGGTLTVASGANITATGNNNSIQTDVVLEEGANLNVNSGGRVTIGASGSTFNLAGGDVNQDIGGGTLTNNGIRVTGDSSINVTTFDWDQGSTVVESGGSLDINVTDIDAAAPTNQYDNNLFLNGGGSVNVDNAANVWLMDGSINYSGGGTVAGDTVHIGDDAGLNDADVNVTGGGVAQITAPVRFQSDADVAVNAGATFRTTGVTEFAPVNGGNNGEFTGTGTWQLAGPNNVFEPTTINMVGGTVDLDNSYLPVTPAFANDTVLNADLTINAATMADYGNRGNFFGTDNFSEIFIADSVTLTVNLDNPNDEWTVNSNGRIDYSGVGGVHDFLAGSDVNMNGILNVTGEGRSAARLDIGGTINSLTPGAGFVLGGGSTSDPNRLEGGVINGPGPLRAETAKALHGFGTINTDVIYATTLSGFGSSNLLADDGTLTINGSLTGIAFLGTADSDGTLNITNPWNTNVASFVDLNGGVLTGQTITNNNPNGITGNGEVAARVINNTRIAAENAGTLRVTNTLTDWDGATENGELHAVAGNLEIVDNGPFGFDGRAIIGPARELFINGFDLDFGSGSELTMSGGTLRSTNAQTIGGVVNINTNTARWETAATIESTAAVTITSELQLDGDTIIEAGATFGGGGALVNEPGRTLTLLDAADVDVLLENEGRLELGASPGQTTGLDFQQFATGIWDVEIQDTGLNDFDRMNLTGVAQLDGTLDLSLLGGFQPDIGDTFNILSASGGVGGSFSDVLQPLTLAAGRLFEVNYLPTIVQLEVVADFDADFDGDNDVDVADLMILQRGFGVGTTQSEGDADYDGDIDADDIAVWEAQFGMGAAVSATLAATAAVPEPATALLLAVGLAFAAGRRRG